MFFRDILFEFIAPPPVEITESKRASQDVATALLKLDKLQLDTSILKAEYFQTITLLPTFPTDSKSLTNFGKANPFLGGFQIVSAPVVASTTVGGVIFSTQRSVNNGQSVVPVTNGRANAPTGRR